MERSTSSAVRWLLPTLALAYVLASLLPVMDSGFYSDDRHWSTTAVGWQKGHPEMGLTGAIAQDVAMWLRNGRFTPINIALYRTVHLLIRDVRVYKAGLILVVLLNALCFYILVRRVSVAPLTALLALSFLPALFQMRVDYHDALLGMYYLMQVLLLFELLSLLFLDRALQARRPVSLVLSVLFHGLALLTYEVGYVLTALHAVLIYGRCRRFRETGLRLLPYAALCAAGVAAMVCAKVAFADTAVEYAGTRAILTPGPVVRTFALQVFSSLPLTYVRFRLPFSSVDSLRQIGAFRNLDLVLMTLAFAGLGLFLVRSATEARPQSPGTLMLVLGLCLWLLPAAPISLAAKYQRELTMGRGYLPVYIQCFGLALLCSWLTVHAVRLSRLRWVRAAAIGFVLTASFATSALTLLNNKHAIPRLNRFHFPQRTLELALQHGMFDEVEEGATLLFVHSYFYGGLTSSYWYPVYAYTGKRVTCMDWKAFRDDMFEKGTEPTDVSTSCVYLVHFAPALRKQARVLLARMHSIGFDADTGRHRILVSNLRYCSAADPSVREVRGQTEHGEMTAPFDRVHRFGRDYIWASVEFDEPANWDTLQIQ